MIFGQIHNTRIYIGGKRKKEEIYRENIRLREKLGEAPDDDDDDEYFTMTVLDRLEQLQKDQEDIKNGIIKKKNRVKVCIDIYSVFFFLKGFISQKPLNHISMSSSYTLPF